MSRHKGITLDGKQVGYVRFDDHLPIPRVSVFTLDHKRLGSAPDFTAAKGLMREHLKTVILQPTGTKPKEGKPR